MMEPMDLDDSLERRRQVDALSTSISSVFPPRCYSAPALSPFYTPQRQKPLMAQRRHEHNHPRTFSSPAVEISPRPIESSSPLITATPWKTLPRSLVFGVSSLDRCVASPAAGSAPARDLFNTLPRAGPCPSWITSPAVSESVDSVSMETSQPSDSSEMEVSQASPSLSPSWDKMSLGLGSLSLFRTASEDLQAKEKGRANGGSGDNAFTSSSWEPALSVVQAVTSFKHGSKERKNSPTKSLSSSEFFSAQQKSVTPAKKAATCIASFTSGAAKVGIATPIRKLDRVEPTAPLPAASSHEEKDDVKLQTVAKDESKLCSCTSLIKLVSVLVLVLSLLLVLPLRQQDLSDRSHAAMMDVELLKNEMASKVFGQHIAIEEVPATVDRYLQELRSKAACTSSGYSHHQGEQEQGGESCSSREANCDSEENGQAVADSTKNIDNQQLASDVSCHISPLVISFHGWTGVGKNFVSDIISRLFPVKTVTKFFVPYHFPHRRLEQMYREQVETWVVSNVTNNHVNFFIFDEMDKAMPGVIQGLQNAIRTLNDQSFYDSPSIFLLLSNSFSARINQRTFQAMAMGRERQSLTMGDYSDLFVSGEETTDGNAWYSQLREAGLITATIPFLPLEKHHVVQCIRRDLVWKKLSTHSDVVNKVLQQLSFTKIKGAQLEFSQTGCKRVSDKVDLVAFDKNL